MTFTAPLFLLAVLAGLIPVLLHMMHHQRAKEEVFPTLRFLRISVQKTRRRKLIQDVFLMLLRIAALVLLAVGLAGPTLTSLAALWGGKRAAVAIILDNSASMGVIDRERPRLETATAAANQILDELHEGDQVGLFIACGPTFTEQDRLDPSREKALQLLRRCRVSHQRADLVQKLQQAQKALAASDAPNKQIFIITDMQAVAWEGIHRQDAESDSRRETEIPSAATPPEEAGQEATEAAKIPIVVVNCNRAPKLNVAITALNLQTTVPVAGAPLRVRVRLLNTASVAQQRHVELYLDGVREAISPALDLPPEGHGEHEFLLVPQRAGWQRGEAQLSGRDGSPYDDRWFFTIEVQQGLPVALVKARSHEIPYLEDTFYLEQALVSGIGGSGALRVDVLRADELEDQPLEGYRVLFCVNLPAPSPGAAARLQRFVATGGSLVWFCGDNVRPNDYNRLGELATALLPARLEQLRAAGGEEGRDSWRLGTLAPQHPALGPLSEPATLYQSVLVYRHVRLNVQGLPECQILARLDDGEPVLVERRLAGGKVLLWGSGAHTTWTNLPLRKIFLPLVARLTFYLAGIEQTRRELLAGAPLVLPLEHERRPVGLALHLPSGETVRRPSEGDPSGGQVFRYSDTYEPGIYLLEQLDGSQRGPWAWSVNLDPDEVSPATLTPEQLQARLAPAPVLFAPDPDDLSSTFQLLREGRSLWSAFLMGVLLVLVFEAFFANRRGQSFEATVDKSASHPRQ